MAAPATLSEIRASLIAGAEDDVFLLQLPNKVELKLRCKTPGQREAWLHFFSNAESLLPQMLDEMTTFRQELAEAEKRAPTDLPASDFDTAAAPGTASGASQGATPIDINVSLRSHRLNHPATRPAVQAWGGFFDEAEGDSWQASTTPAPSSAAPKNASAAHSPKTEKRSAPIVAQNDPWQPTTISTEAAADNSSDSADIVLADAPASAPARPYNEELDRALALAMTLGLNVQASTTSSASQPEQADPWAAPSSPVTPVRTTTFDISKSQPVVTALNINHRPSLNAPAMDRPLKAPPSAEFPASFDSPQARSSMGSVGSSPKGIRRVIIAPAASLADESA